MEQNIQSAIGDSSVEVGDNFTSTKDHGEVQITVEKFEYGVDKFPVTFESNPDTSLENDDVVPLEGDYDETVIFKIEYDEVEDETTTLAASDETTTLADSDDMTTLSDTTIADDSTDNPVPTTAQSTKTVSKDKKLLNDVKEQPILTTV